MLFKKEQLETTMRERLKAIRDSAASAAESKRTSAASGTGFGPGQEQPEEGSSSSSRIGSNRMRNQRRARHYQAVVEDLCSVVAELFLAESKLLKPYHYGVATFADDSAPPGKSPPRVPVRGAASGSSAESAPSDAAAIADDSRSGTSTFEREQVVRCIHNFVSALPSRYALSADTPSEVLLHMRLMAAARSDKTKVAVHIHNVDGSDGGRFADPAVHHPGNLLRLVTICCNDATGLLEYITKLLATGGSRVLDADVMLSTDGIVL